MSGTQDSVIISCLEEVIALFTEGTEKLYLHKMDVSSSNKSHRLLKIFLSRNSVNTEFFPFSIEQPCEIG